MYFKNVLDKNCQNTIAPLNKVISSGHRDWY